MNPYKTLEPIRGPGSALKKITQLVKTKKPKNPKKPRKTKKVVK